jgi:WD40 repeat protein
VENWRSTLELAWQGQLSDLVTALVCAPNGSGWVASSAAGEVSWMSGLLDRVELQSAVGMSIDSIAFSADSRWLAAGGQAGELLIWNCEDPHLPPQLVSTIGVNRWIEHLAWHPTKSALAISYGAQIEIWDIEADQQLVTWKFDRSSIFDLAWHPTGSYLAVAGYKGVQIWSPDNPTVPVQRISLDTASLTIAWSDDGSYLAVGNLDRTLTIVDWHHPADPWILQGCPGKIRQIAWISGHTALCLAVASGSELVIWNLSADLTNWDGQLLDGHQDIIKSLVSHPQLPLVASGGADGYTCIWSATGSIEQIITNGINKFTTLRWHPQGEYLVTGSQTGSIELWTRSQHKY